MHITVILSGQQTKLVDGQKLYLLNDLAANHRQLEIASVNEPAKSRRDILASLAVNGGLEHNSQQQTLGSVVSKMVALVAGSERLGRELGIIKSLHFTTISERQLHENNGAEASLLNWLRTRNDTYWVSGRAGSGKSTLMKYLHHHTKKNSQHGLLQTLLYSILRQCPAQIPSVCPTLWQDPSLTGFVWTLTELSNAFNRLKVQTLDSTKFCFFIDGLDEYEGDHTELIALVKEFASSSNIKICFSGRPWNVFEQAYGDNTGLKLRLQDLTRGDITCFVTGKLAEELQFRRLKAEDNSYGDLVNEIVERAHGMFLWVFLVVLSLRRGLTNSDTISELQTRLQILPTELEEYFQHMLDLVEKVYHKQAARIYLMRLSSPVELRTIIASYFDKEDPHFALKTRIKPSNAKEIRRTRTRILVRCTDLLELSTDSRQVDYLHRTVQAFLETQDIRRQLQERAGPEFYTHHHLCKPILSRIISKLRFTERTSQIIGELQVGERNKQYGVVLEDF